jgi:hypothetical protein
MIALAHGIETEHGPGRNGGRDRGHDDADQTRCRPCDAR